MKIKLYEKRRQHCWLAVVELKTGTVTELKPAGPPQGLTRDSSSFLAGISPKWRWMYIFCKIHFFLYLTNTLTFRLNIFSQCQLYSNLKNIF